MHLLKRLFEELDLDFTRAHKQIHFDLKLPYDKEKYKQLHQVLPIEKFIPVSERVVDHVKPPALHRIPERNWYDIESQDRSFEGILDQL